MALLRRASLRGPRGVVSWCALARARWPRIAGRSRGPKQQRQGRRSRRADLGRNRTESGPAESQRSGDSAIATRLGLWVRFSDWSEEGQTVRSSRRSGGRKTPSWVRRRRDHTKGGGCVVRQGVARWRAAGAQRARPMAPTRACSRRRRRPRPRGRGRRPRTAGTETGTDVDAFISRRTPRSP